MTGVDPVDFRRMLTRKSKYGLKALLMLAEKRAAARCRFPSWPNSQRIPAKFLEAILLDLKRHGLLQSKKGKGGGYALSRRPSEITVGQIIRVLEGPLALVPCVSQTAYMPCDECVDEATCRVEVGDEGSSRRDGEDPGQHVSHGPEREGPPLRPARRG